ncbi:MAG: class I SAM-dependent methyltransferase [Solirubrobacteraceae bacterium]
MSPATHSAEGIVTGNTFDKYGSRNPVVRLLMGGFERNLAELFTSAEPQSVLDIGCGEGVLTHRWATELAPRRVVGIDLDDPLIAAEWAKRSAPNLEFVAHRAERLPFADDEFDIATAIELLEHVPDPSHTIAEMARCASRHILVSVPHEPLWRALNMARGAYWRSLGNTPGHINHFSRRALVSLCAEHGDVIETRSPFPWTMVLVRV